MYKKLLGTAAAFLSAIMIAAGGMYALRLGLRSEEKSMLSEAGTVEWKSVSGDREGKGDSASVSYVKADTSLSEEELYQILKKREDTKIVQPHEPYYGQLTMQQAVEKGSKWLKHFREQNTSLNISENLGRKVWADLARAGEEETLPVDGNRLFSSWHLSFYEPETTVDMEINAVTGEVLVMNIYKESVKMTREDRKKMLETFAAQFEFPKDGEIQEEGNYLVQSLCGGRFYVVEEDVYTERYDGTGNGSCSFQIEIITRKPVS